MASSGVATVAWTRHEEFESFTDHVGMVQRLAALLTAYDDEAPVAEIIAGQPDVAYAISRVQYLSGQPYAEIRGDLGSADFLPSQLIRFFLGCLGMECSNPLSMRYVRGVFFQGMRPAARNRRRDAGRLGVARAASGGAAGHCGLNAVLVAMAEIVREGTWALRALGYPYGTAERAAPLLAWTEAVHGHGLTMLRLGETAIAAGAAWPAPIWRRDGAGHPAGRGAGQVPVRMRAARARPRNRRCEGLGRRGPGCAARRDRDTAVGRVGGGGGAARLGCHARACARAARRSRPYRRRGGFAQLPTPSGPAFLAGSLEQSLPTSLPAALQLAAEDVAAARIAGEAGYFSIAVLPCSPLAPPPGAADWPERLALAYRTGNAADAADYASLYALEARTWAPTSERSRAQAGYGRF